MQRSSGRRCNVRGRVPPEASTDQNFLFGRRTNRQSSRLNKLSSKNRMANRGNARRDERANGCSKQPAARPRLYRRSQNDCSRRSANGRNRRGPIPQRCPAAMPQRREKRRICEVGSRSVPTDNTPSPLSLHGFYTVCLHSKSDLERGPYSIRTGHQRQFRSDQGRD